MTGTAEQVSAARSIYQAEITVSGRPQFGSDSCVYAVTITKTMLGEEKVGDTIDNVEVQPYDPEIPLPMECLAVGEEIILIEAERGSEAGIHNCGNSSVHRIEEKNEIEKILEK